MGKEKTVKDYIWQYFLLILGAFILSFGDAMFLAKQSIVSGGINGIAIIVQYFVNKGGSTFEVIDIVTWILYGIFWVLSFFFVGKKFAMRTLVATISLPLFMTLFLRVLIPYVPFFQDFLNQVSGDGTVGYMMLCGLFGGICVGAGMSVTFVGGGSTGGLDVLTFIVNKYTHIKISIISLLIDGTIIVVGMICMQQYVNALCGILSAVVVSLVVEIIYVKRQSSCQADIISEKYQEISTFVQDELGRGTTIINAKGGYKGDDRPMLRVVIDKTQYSKLKDFLAETDPKAFVTFTITKAVYGEGFDRNSKIIVKSKDDKKN